MKIHKLKDALTDLLVQAVAELYDPQAGETARALLTEDGLTPCKNPDHGDYATNLAFRLASPLKAKPYELAQQISQWVSCRIMEQGLPCQRIEIILPGFMNFVLQAAAFGDVVPEVVGRDTGYGCRENAAGPRVLVEFVSANPTGPLTVAHGRQAAVGDSLGNILAASGCRVVREYYLNDRGRQMDLLARSARARYAQTFDANAPMPEDGYQGDYMREIGKAVREKFGDRFVREAESPEQHLFFLDFAKDTILEGIRKDLADFSVRFDSWFSEREFATPEVIRKMLDDLRASGYLYEQEGAVWLASSRLGDDKDRVLVKSSGEYTYITPDLAYHMRKFARGFDRLVDLWGPDHHGYIPRIKAGIKALGGNPDALSVLIVQLCTLFRGKEKVQMSTRAGEFITLREVMDEVGPDATRFHFLMIKPESHLNFDLEVAKQQSMENPVYYLQYAHARICSVFDKYAEQFGRKLDFADCPFDVGKLSMPGEARLLRLLVLYPGAIDRAAAALDPHEIILYLQELATVFHGYYNKCRVLGEDAGLMHTRCMLLRAVQVVLRNGLALLGIRAPEKM